MRDCSVGGVWDGSGVEGSLEASMNAKVYWNSRKKMYSVMMDGKVQYHTHYMILKNVKLKVRKSAREKVLKTGVKNVHAFVCGEVYHKLPDEAKDVFEYNPFKYGHFFKAGGEKVDTADYAILYTETGKPKMHGVNLTNAEDVV